MVYKFICFLLKFRGQKRFYNHGLLEMRQYPDLYDDRTLPEKWWDWLLDRKEEIEKRARRPISYFFNSYFDWATGTHIISKAQRDAIARKKGYAVLSPKELEQENNRKERRQIQKDRSDVRMHLQKSIREIKQGRSFSKEVALERQKRTREHFKKYII